MADASTSWAIQALLRDAERAGSAMGCRYLSADEYEAALIAERRAAGAYGPVRRRAHAWIACVMAGMPALTGIPFIR